MLFVSTFQLGVILVTLLAGMSLFVFHWCCAGIADSLKHVGPNEVSITGDSLLKYCIDEAPELFDIYSCHFYPAINLSSSDVLYGTVYKTNVSDLAAEYSNLYVGVVKLEDGSWTITVVNLNIDDTTFTVSFDKKINQTLYRHIEGATTVKPNAEAKLADADKTYVNVGDKFIDTIPGGSIAIYTGVKG